MALLNVYNLSVSFVARGKVHNAVQNLSFSVSEGETLAIVGESGSGKSVSCYALLGLIPSPPGVIGYGAAMFEGRDLLANSSAELRRLRGDQIAMVFQDPMSCLNPFLSVGEQLLEPLIYRGHVKRSDAKRRAIELLTEVGIDEPEKNINRYPFEFSGGMRQRVMIAMALISRPKLLIADEPTAALDVTVQAQVLSLLAELQAKHNFAIIFVSHDLAVVEQLADRVLVMQKGKIVEQGNCKEVFTKPKRTYTQTLLAAVPSGIKKKSTKHENSPVLLKVHDLASGYNIQEARGYAFKRVVEHISFTIRRSEIVGLVGESGSGKSTIGRAILKLLPTVEGSIHFDWQRIDTLSEANMRPLRTRIQMIFQDPYASLNPRMTVFEVLSEPLLFHKLANELTVVGKVNALLDEVGLAHDYVRKYPHELSGGEQQRIAIARALACRPDLIVADEPVSALDLTVQAQIMELLLRLVEKYRLSMLLISHDLSVIRVFCDHVVVLRDGKMVEQNDTETLWAAPRHEYTKALLSTKLIGD